MPLPGKKRYVGRKNSPGLSFRFDHSSRPVIMGRFARKNTTLFYSSLFTKQAETPINTGGVGCEECTATLHHSSLIVRLCYFFFLGLVIIYVRVWSSFMLRLGHHLCQGLVIIGDGTFACLIFFFPKMVWVKSCEEW